jgi:hypothetical protein
MPSKQDPLVSESALPTFVPEEIEEPLLLSANDRTAPNSSVKSSHTPRSKFTSHLELKDDFLDETEGLSLTSLVKSNLVSSDHPTRTSLEHVPFNNHPDGTNGINLFEIPLVSNNADLMPFSCESDLTQYRQYLEAVQENPTSLNYNKDDFIVSILEIFFFINTKQLVLCFINIFIYFYSSINLCSHVS